MAFQSRLLPHRVPYWSVSLTWTFITYLFDCNVFVWALWCHSRLPDEETVFFNLLSLSSCFSIRRCQELLTCKLIQSSGWISWMSRACSWRSRVNFGNNWNIKGLSGRNRLKAASKDTLIAKLHLLTEEIEMTQNLLHALFHILVIMSFDLHE